MPSTLEYISLTFMNLPILHLKRWCDCFRMLDLRPWILNFRVHGYVGRVWVSYLYLELSRRSRSQFSLKIVACLSQVMSLHISGRKQLERKIGGGNDEEKFFALNEFLINFCIKFKEEFWKLKRGKKVVYWCKQSIKITPQSIWLQLTFPLFLSCWILC